MDKFLQGEHRLRHKQEIWNGIWSGMMIETTFMKLGKVLQELLGKQQIAQMQRSTKKFRQVT